MPHGPKARGKLGSADIVDASGRPHQYDRLREDVLDSPQSKTLYAPGTSAHGIWETLPLPSLRNGKGRKAKPHTRSTEMNGVRESDGPIRSKTDPNKDALRRATAEGPEESGPAKDNPRKAHQERTQSRTDLDAALTRIRERAKSHPREKFTALLHHVYDIHRLREAYYELNRKASGGVDEVTWEQYGKQLEANLSDLRERLRNSAYRVPPVLRAYIPKPDGKLRPISIPTLEDRIVQHAMDQVVGSIYEADFMGFSYGSRRGKSQHDALDALATGIYKKKVNYLLDADIQGFFDTLKHDALMEMLEERIGDKRVLKLIHYWMSADVLNDGAIETTTQGVPQGGSISPLLANIYLHKVLDGWTHQWRQTHGRGDVIITRYVDDFVVGFQYESTARAYQSALKERLNAYGLRLHPDKTRLIEFGRYANERRSKRKEGQAETFEFLGFVHICSTTRNGRFALKRHTSRKKFRNKLKQIKGKLRQRGAWAKGKIGRWLRSVVVGHNRYYAVPHNFKALVAFRNEITKLWLKTMRRLSQRTRMTWKRMRALAKKWLPQPKIYHPHPEKRFSTS